MKGSVRHKNYIEACLAAIRVVHQVSREKGFAVGDKISDSGKVRRGAYGDCLVEDQAGVHNVVAEWAVRGATRRVLGICESTLVRRAETHLRVHADTDFSVRPCRSMGRLWVRVSNLRRGLVARTGPQGRPDPSPLGEGMTAQFLMAMTAHGPVESFSSLWKILQKSCAEALAMMRFGVAICEVVAIVGTAIVAARRIAGRTGGINTSLALAERLASL